MGDEDAAKVAARLRFRQNLNRQKDLKDEIKQLLQNGKAKEALERSEKALESFPEHQGILELMKEARSKLGLPPT